MFQEASRFLQSRGLLFLFFELFYSFLHQCQSIFNITFDFNFFILGLRFLLFRQWLCFPLTNIVISFSRYHIFDQIMITNHQNLQTKIFDLKMRQHKTKLKESQKISICIQQTDVRGLSQVESRDCEIIILSIKEQNQNLMLLNTFTNPENTLSEEPFSKVTSSQGTDVSEPLPLSKQISLKSCPSCMSIPEQSQDRTENELFAPYLFAMTSKQKELAFQAMKNHFQLAKQEDNQSAFYFESCSTATTTEEDEVLGYFISQWLVFMGYGTSANKKYYASRVKAMVGLEQMHLFTKIYKRIGLLSSSQQQLNQFLVQTCRNGWEYFVREVVARVIKGQAFQN